MVSAITPAVCTDKGTGWGREDGSMTRRLSAEHTVAPSERHPQAYMERLDWPLSLLSDPGLSFSRATKSIREYVNKPHT